MNIISYGTSFLSAGSFFNFDLGFSSIMENRTVVKLCETVSIIGTTAGIISSIAYFVLRLKNYFVVSVATLPLGVISWVYLSKYQVAAEELKDREVLENAVDRMDQEGEEIRGAVSKLEQEIASLKTSKSQLESQISLLTTSNTELGEAVEGMRAENRNLLETRQKLTEDLAVLDRLEKKIQEHSSQVVENLEQTAHQTSLNVEELVRTGSDVQERLTRITSIYEKLMLVNQVQSNLIELAQSDRSRLDEIFRDVPNLKKILDFNLSNQEGHA